MHTFLTLLLGLGLFVGHATLARMDQGSIRPAAIQVQTENTVDNCCCCCCCCTVSQSCGCTTCENVTASSCGGASCTTGSRRQ